jgi:hypothetical protein
MAAVSALVAGVACASGESNGLRERDAAVDVSSDGDGGDAGDEGDGGREVGTSDGVPPGPDGSDAFAGGDAIVDGSEELPEVSTCKTAADCPPPVNQCLVATCTGYVCGTQEVPQGVEVAKDSPPDCHGTFCDGMGYAVQGLDPTNVPPSSNPCVASLCNSWGNPATAPVATGTPCAASGGKLCDGTGNCVQCLHSSDCAGGKVCDALDDCIDLPLSCQDGVKDGTETDVDCGGSLCLPCANGRTCHADADCTSAHCDPAVHTCRSVLCFDGVQDGGETDVDFGGPGCTPCAIGHGCQVNQDCVSDGCDATTHLCVFNQCHDGMKDGAETDVDCGGTTCSPCAVGQGCLAGTDCLSTLTCISLRCWAPTCNDGVSDGTETGIDCGGGDCPECGLAQGCALDSDCQSGARDGVSLVCVANQCADHRTDGTETDVDCGGGTCACCLVGRTCGKNIDCCPGHVCNSSKQCQ